MKKPKLPFVLTLTRKDGCTGATITSWRGKPIVNTPPYYQREDEIVIKCTLAQLDRFYKKYTVLTTQYTNKFLIVNYTKR